MGLLDSMGAQQAPGQAAPMGGLLGSAPPAQGGAVDPAMKAQWLQMCQTLIQNPTPEAVQQIIAQLQSSGAEGMEKLIPMLQQMANDPEALRQLAQQAMQELSK